MNIHDSEVCLIYGEPVLPDEEGKCSLCGAVLTGVGHSVARTLVVSITDEDKTFTEQLGQIVMLINEGYTSGYGWNIGAFQPKEK